MSNAYFAGLLAGIYFNKFSDFQFLIKIFNLQRKVGLEANENRKYHLTHFFVCTKIYLSCS